MASEITVRQLDPRWIDSLRPLWLALRDHHHAVAPVAANTRVLAVYERRGFGVPFVRMAAEGPPSAPGT